MHGGLLRSLHGSRRALSSSPGRRRGPDAAAAGQRRGVGAAVRQSLVQVHQGAAGLGGEEAECGWVSLNPSMLLFRKTA